LVLLGILAFSALTPSTVVSAAPAGIPQADQLAAIAARSNQQALPVIVFVTREGCPYCRSLRNAVLLPMLKGGQFEQRANLVEVSLDARLPFSDFDGRPVSATEFGARYKVNITPTLLFLDANGRELTKPRVGISNLDLYGFYLDRSINEAMSELTSAE
jgi:thioredoxin-related protein